MFEPKRVMSVLLGCGLLCLGGCILVPDDGGGHGGHEHEDREHHDHDDEHRHDFGVSQKERLGADALQPALRAALASSAAWQSAVFVPPRGKTRKQPLWA
jgi:hypothetical protein